MALDVWLNGKGELPFIEEAHRMELIASLEHYEGPFNYLARYWAEVEGDDGPIDPWEGTAFQGDALARLESCLSVARVAALVREASWQEHTGTLMSEPPKELYGTVDRDQLVELIDRLIDAARRARESDKQLLFFGD